MRRSSGWNSWIGRALGLRRPKHLLDPVGHGPDGFAYLPTPRAADRRDDGPDWSVAQQQRKGRACVARLFGARRPGDLGSAALGPCTSSRSILLPTHPASDTQFAERLSQLFGDGHHGAQRTFELGPRPDVARGQICRYDQCLREALSCEQASGVKTPHAAPPDQPLLPTPTGRVGLRALSRPAR